MTNDELSKISQLLDEKLKGLENRMKKEDDARERRTNKKFREIHTDIAI